MNPQQILEEIDAVDVLTLGCKSDPVPAKDVDDQLVFSEMGYHAGTLKMTDTFKDDLITVPIYNENGKSIGTHRVCRWAYIPVNEKNVSTYFNRKEQDFQVHGSAQ